MIDGASQGKDSGKGKRIKKESITYRKLGLFLMLRKGGHKEGGQILMEREEIVGGSSPKK